MLMMEIQVPCVWLGFGKNGTFGNTGIGGSNRRHGLLKVNSYIASSAHVTLNGSLWLCSSPQVSS